MSSGVTDSSLKYHLENAKKAGVSKKEIAAVITHVAFYVGWPKGWAVFNMAKEVWCDNDTYEDEKAFLACKLLLERGVYVNPVISPATPIGKALIRTSYSATHKKRDIDEAVEKIEEVIKMLKITKPTN